MVNYEKNYETKTPIETPNEYRRRRNGISGLVLAALVIVVLAVGGAYWNANRTAAYNANTLSPASGNASAGTMANNGANNGANSTTTAPAANNSSTTTSATTGNAPNPAATYP